MCRRRGPCQACVCSTTSPLRFSLHGLTSSLLRLATASPPIALEPIGRPLSRCPPPYLAARRKHRHTDEPSLSHPYDPLSLVLVQEPDAPRSKPAAHRLLSSWRCTTAVATPGVPTRGNRPRPHFF